MTSRTGWGCRWGQRGLPSLCEAMASAPNSLSCSLTTPLSHTQWVPWYVMCFYADTTQYQIFWWRFLETEINILKKVNLWLQKYLHLCALVYMPVHAWVTCVHHMHTGSQRSGEVSNSLKLELQTMVSHHVMLSRTSALDHQALYWITKPYLKYKLRVMLLHNTL